MGVGQVDAGFLDVAADLPVAVDRDGNAKRERLAQVVPYLIREGIGLFVMTARFPARRIAAVEVGTQGHSRPAGAFRDLQRHLRRVGAEGGSRYLGLHLERFQVDLVPGQNRRLKGFGRFGHLNVEIVGNRDIHQLHQRYPGQVEVVLRRDDREVVGGQLRLNLEQVAFRRFSGIDQLFGAVGLGGGGFHLAPGRLQDLLRKQHLQIPGGDVQGDVVFRLFDVALTGQDRDGVLPDGVGGLKTVEEVNAAAHTEVGGGVPFGDVRV